MGGGIGVAAAGGAVEGEVERGGVGETGLQLGAIFGPVEAFTVGGDGAEPGDRAVDMRIDVEGSGEGCRAGE